MVTLVNLVNKLYGYVLIATPLAPIVMAQPPIHSFHFLLVIAVSLFKFCGTFPYILPLALLTGSKVNYKAAFAVQPLLDWVGPTCVGACE